MLNALCALGGLLVGIFAGWRVALVLHPKLRKRSPDSEDIAKYMKRVVNQEAIEEHRKLLRLHMLEVGRRSIRADGGPPARVMRMRKRRKGVRPDSA